MVKSVENIETIKTELRNRIAVLLDVLNGRVLIDNHEEAGRHRHWPHPDKMRVIDSYKLSLALGDFKTILTEVGKLK